MERINISEMSEAFAETLRLRNETLPSLEAAGEG